LKCKTKGITLGDVLNLICPNWTIKNQTNTPSCMPS